MGKFVAWILALILIIPATGLARDVTNEELISELRALRKRVELLEKKIEKQKREMESSRRKSTENQKRLEEELKEVRKLREILKGISVEGGITVVGQGTLNSDHGKDKAYKKETDMSYSASLIIYKETENMGRLGHGVMSIHIEGADGPDRWLKDLQDSSWSSVNEDYSSPVDMGNVNLREAWYEHYLFGDKFVVTLGKLDVTAYVDENEVANDEEVQFLGGEFVNNPIIPFPDYGPGLRLTVYPKDSLSLTAVLMSVDRNDEGSSSWSDIFDGVFGIGQLGIKANPFGLSGSYRFMGWFNTSKHADYSKDGKERNRNNYGFALDIDQEILKDTLFAFLRAGWSEPDLNEASFVLSLGARLFGRWWGRPRDELAVAYGLIGESHEFRDYQRLIGGTQTENQHHVEAYYKFSLGEHLEISLDYQFLSNPGGHRNIKDAHLLGVRTHFGF